MTGFLVLIICVIISVVCFNKVANRCRNKSNGKFRTLLTASITSFFVFIITMGIGVAGFVTSDKSNKNQRATEGNSPTTVGNTGKSNVEIYTCDKFDGVTQTRQGTKYDSGYYSDGEVKTKITYSITDETLTTKMVTPGFDDITDTAKFNKTAADGSRKYGNSSSNYFVSAMNDTTIKVVLVKFSANMTLTQICSK
ncbi:hypothetical protein [Pectobacterium brasiliense]|uniref:hypothetical protein n=1 Tax=Pectobacterium brasiliense TaxID=180957 RepID=UPI0019D38C54|nr:hypothetical protein [Pectobacterium brasiliense]MBN7765277.1 hypothetical protein [Pectobacterium brasiliense]